MIIYKKKAIFYIETKNKKTEIKVKGPFAIATYKEFNQDELDIVFERMVDETDFKDEEKLVISCFI